MMADYEPNASWAGVTFWVTDLSGSAQRRWAVYEGAYRDGGESDDLGRKPRQETYQASLTVQDFIKLEKAVNAREVHLFHHLFLGKFNARLRILTYAKSVKSRIRCAIEVLEYRGQDTAVITPSANQKGAQAAALWSDAYNAIQNMETPVEDVNTSFDDAAESWSALYEVIQLADAGQATWEDVDRARSAFSTAANVLIEQLQAVEDSPEAWNAIDATLRAQAEILEFADVTLAEPAYQPALRLTATTDLYTLCWNIWGHGDYVDQIFATNNLLDPFMIPEGTELKMPPYGV